MPSSYIAYIATIVKAESHNLWAEKVAGVAEMMEEVGGNGFVFNGPVTRRYIAETTDASFPCFSAVAWCARPTNTGTFVTISSPSEAWDERSIRDRQF
jgi:hypothetical protein